MKIQKIVYITILCIIERFVKKIKRDPKDFDFPSRNLKGPIYD